MNLTKYGIFTYAKDGIEDGPKNETLEEHKKHCKAEPGNCPFEKKIAEKAEEEDVEGVASAGGGANNVEEPKEPAVDLDKTAKLLEMAFASAAKSVGENFLDKDLFSVKPSMTWDPILQKEKPTGGFTVTAAVHGGESECNSFLNKLAKALGISRKAHDCYPGEKDSRINTHVTADEAKNALVKLDELKAKAAEKAQKAAEEAKEKEANTKRDNILTMTTAAVTLGAKTVNFHVSQGDFAPDKSKIDAAMNAKKDVDALLNGDYGELSEKQKAQAEALSKAVGEISASYFQGKHNVVGMVPQMESPKPVAKPSKLEGDAGNAAPTVAKADGAKPPTSGTSAVDLSKIHQAVLGAAKTINFHIEQGDCHPNQMKIKALFDAAKAMHDAYPDGKSDDPDAVALMSALKEIANSGKAGWKNKIGFVKPLSNPKAGSVGKSGVDFLKAAMLHHKSKGSEPQKPSAGEAPDAYEYDENRWAHMAAPATAAGAMKDAADALSMDEATAQLKEWGYEATTGAQDLVAKGFPASIAKKVSEAKHTAAKGKIFDDSVKCAVAAIADLNKRFPNMLKPHLSCIFPSIPKSLNCGAEWVKGDESNAAFSSICFHADYDKTDFGGEYSYGHNDSRLPFDIFRHEYMHAISTGAVAKQWKQFVAETYGKPCKGFFKLMKSKVSGYAASGDIYESQAEIFAMMTSHDYKPGTLPRPIEDFFYGKVMGGEPAEGGHQHLMHDPNKKPDVQPKSDGGKSEDVSVDDLMAWFAPEKQAVKAPAMEKVFA